MLADFREEAAVLQLLLSKFDSRDPDSIPSRRTRPAGAPPRDQRGRSRYQLRGVSIRARGAGASVGLARHTRHRGSAPARPRTWCSTSSSRRVSSICMMCNRWSVEWAPASTQIACVSGADDSRRSSRSRSCSTHSRLRSGSQVGCDSGHVGSVSHRVTVLRSTHRNFRERRRDQGNCYDRQRRLLTRSV